MRDHPSRPGPISLSKADWVAAARTALITDGIAGVRVERLARQLKVTTGSFYWHFPDRPALLAALRRDWLRAGTAPFLQAARAAQPDPMAILQAISAVLLAETDYRPAYDLAMRDWARTDPVIGSTVRRIDNFRIRLLTRLVMALGDPPDQAFIRARIIYFHQVGYHALGIVETAARRQALLPIYLEILMGRPVATSPAAPLDP